MFLIQVRKPNVNGGNWYRIWCSAPHDGADCAEYLRSIAMNNKLYSEGREIRMVFDPDCTDSPSKG